MRSGGRLFLGIDGGGTGCRALLCDAEARPLGSGSAGPANIIIDFQGALNNVMMATKDALTDAGLSHNVLHDVSAFLGLAGANHRQLADKFKDLLPFRNNAVGTDARAALQGAIGDGDGMVALIGTGAVYIYRVDGEIRTVGGWGFMIGDLASGAWLGRRLLQETLLAYDRIHSDSQLTRDVLRQFENNPETVVEYARAAPPGEFAKFAPIIFEYAEQSDSVAITILGKAISHIEETLDVIFTQENGRFCMLGGLGKKYATLLNKHYRERLSAPDADGVTGAARLARRHFCEQGGTNVG